jgi:hypothetical protein
MNEESIVVPRQETRLVRVQYDPEPKYLSETLGVLAPDAQGEQVLFIHTHLAQEQVLPWITKIIDYETGQIIRVSGSWLGGNQQAAINRQK